MLQKINFTNLLLFVVMLLSANIASAQKGKDTGKTTSTKTSSAKASAQAGVKEFDDAVIRKKDKKQHEQWKKGDYNFPGKPRNMWQVGVHGGSFTISGDVNERLGWGAGFHVRKALGYVFSLRFDAFTGRAYGLNYLPEDSPSSLNQNPVLQQSVANENLKRMYYNFQNKYYAGRIQGIVNLNNLLFHKKQNKISLYALAGVGANGTRVAYDMRDANGALYSFNTADGVNMPTELTGPNGNYQFDLRKDRKAALSYLRGQMDHTYETLAEQDENNIEDIGEYAIHPELSVGYGFEFRITKHFSVALEHQAYITDDDLLDGKRWETAGTRGMTRNMDFPHYIHVRLNFNLGSSKKRVEPLWFVNPLNTAYDQIANQKKKVDDLDDMLADDDNDGVPNRLDKEANTPADSPVDVRGRQLDSDGDGVVNAQDKEPYSPPGYPTDPNGVAQVPKFTTPDDVRNLGDQRYALKDDLNKCCNAGKGSGLTDLFLPMIHFDLDKCYLKPEFFGELKYVGTLMQKHTDAKIVVKGHTDTRNDDCYNQKLSYARAKNAIEYLVANYGISRDRLILQYGGEVENLAKAANNESSHYMNRRVEFSIAGANDKEMAAPGCPGKSPDDKSCDPASFRSVNVRGSSEGTSTKAASQGGKVDLRKYGKEKP